MAADIERDHPGDDPIHLICVLKGGFMFLSDLVRAMSNRVSLDFIAVSSYGKGTKSSGEVRMLKDLDSGIEGRDVVVVEDIIDTGLRSPTSATSSAPGPPATCEPRACSASRRAGWSTSRSSTSGSTSRTTSSSATASTTPNSIATCPTSACSASATDGPRAQTIPRNPAR